MKEISGQILSSLNLDVYNACEENTGLWLMIYYFYWNR